MGFFSSPAWDAVPIWSLDLETGGLDPRKDPILAVGLLPIRGGTVRLGEAFSSLIRPLPGAAIKPESVRAHQLVPADLDSAPLLSEILPEIDRRIREGVLLVHVRGIDIPFLRAAYRLNVKKWPSPPVLDTASLLQREARIEQRSVPELAEMPHLVQLAKAREAHGLPPYPAHDPMSDALSTAELFLVLRARLGARTVRDLVRMSKSFLGPF